MAARGDVLQGATVGKKESKEKFRFTPKQAIAVGVASLALLAGQQVFKLGQATREGQIEDARKTGKENTAMALQLGRFGFTNVVDLVQLDDGRTLASLSANPADASACEVDFVLNNMSSKGGPSLTLDQPDASGKIYSRLDIRSGQQARAVVADLCS